MRVVTLPLLVLAAASFVVAPGCACDPPAAEGEGEGEGEEGEGEEGEGEGEGEAEGEPECQTAVDCDDGDACTVETCVAGACARATALDGTACGDDPCTGEAGCQAGACVPGALVTFDADADGSPSAACFPFGDCNDSDPAVFPAAGEDGAGACGDGIDNDCDGATDDDDIGCGGTSVCDSGWCFENPLPHGFAHRALWPVGDEVWLGGDGLFLGSGALGSMTFAGTGDSLAVIDLWVSPDDESDVWVVGLDGSRHVLGRRTAGVFTFEDARVPAPTALFGFGGDDVWMAGQTGVIAHFDGTAWSPIGDVGAISSIHGSASDDVWFVGGSELIHWDGAALTPFSPDVAGFFTAVWAVSEVVAFAAGPQGVWQFDGAGWTKMPTVPGGNTITATSATDVWVAGNGGQSFHYDGSTWLFTQIGPPGAAIVELHARSATDVWAAGGAGTLVHYDGTTWSHPSGGIPSSAFLIDVEAAADAAGDVTAFATARDFRTGALGIYQRGAGGLWAQTGPESGAIVVAAHGADDVWALLGSQGHHYDGSAWSTVNLSPPTLRSGTNNTNDACATSDGVFYAVGSDFGSIRDTYVLRFDGSDWVVDIDFQPFAGQNDPLVKQVHCVGTDVWLSGPDELWKRSSSGEWQRHGLQALAEGRSPVRGFVGETSWWAVATDQDDNATGVVHFNGRDVVEVRVPELDRDTSFTDVGGLADDDVWLVGEGFAYHWDGSALVKRDLRFNGVAPDFRFVFPFADNDVVFVDIDGSIFRFTGSDDLAQLLQSSSANLSGGSALDASHIWLIDSGTVEFFDGTAVRSQNVRALAVHAFAADDVWAVGDDSDIAHFDGSTWQTESLANTGRFTSVGGTSGSDVWVGGSSVWRNTGAGFVQQPPETPNGFVLSSATQTWFLAGTSAARVEGGVPVVVPILGAVVHLQAVDGGVVAVDEDGGVWRQTTGPFVPVVAGAPNSQVLAAHFTSASEGYLVGTFGFQQTIARFGGTAITPLPLGNAFGGVGLGRISGVGSRMVAVGVLNAVIMVNGLDRP